eukprot:GHVQ01001119.1.p1 GENE.GHVQ01001119.1~~GHVQ01001119.1.p1  ORF type:complete len:134 (+),score=9.58 GHVQ01001119.1:109-510(+)
MLYAVPRVAQRRCCDMVWMRGIICTDVCVICTDLCVRCTDVCVRCTDVCVRCTDVCVTCTDACVHVQIHASYVQIHVLNDRYIWYMYRYIHMSDVCTHSARVCALYRGMKSVLYSVCNLFVVFCTAASAVVCV